MLGAMERHIDQQLAKIAATQHRVFSRAQALSIGASEDLIDRRLASGEWVGIANGVYHFRGADPDWYGLAHGALIDAGPDSMIAHGAAARLDRCPGYRYNGVEILVPRALD